MKPLNTTLTTRESRLLEALRSNPGMYFTRKQLMDFLSPGVKVLDRTVDVHIKSIRKKLPHLQDSIETVRGIGYRYASHSSSFKELISPPS